MLGELQVTSRAHKDQPADAQNHRLEFHGSDAINQKLVVDIGEGGRSRPPAEWLTAHDLLKNTGRRHGEIRIEFLARAAVHCSIIKIK